MGEGDVQFWKEIMILSQCRHENLISLLRFCHEDSERILVYEYASRGSLDRYLGDASLTWTQRLKICLGAAYGLNYLHDPMNILGGVLHLDVKSSNILLDEKWNAKITDFGLSKFGTANQQYAYLISNAMGTSGYCDPLYLETGILSKESDVYSFGVVLFEVMCGSLCFESHKGHHRVLIPMWKKCYKENGPDDILFHHIKEQVDKDSLITFSSIAYRCLNRDRKERPTMAKIVEKLEIALDEQEMFQDVEKGIKFEVIKKNADQAATALSHRSRKELNLLLSNGALLNEGKTLCRKFSFGEIKRATNEFSEQNFLGKGAFGSVYRGNIFGNGYTGVVAVKRMSIDPEQGIPAFQKEIDLLSNCHHVNIIRLVGYCEEEDEKILLYEFMPNGSLYDYLYHHKEGTPLTVEQRLEICLGVANGLNYLHSRKDYNIIHSDLKTDNILLDANLIPKIADFGLCRTRVAGPSSSETITNNIQGTEGYIAPECYEPNYMLSRKADVYAFGVVMLELLCERPAWKRLVTFALPLIWRGELPKFTPKYVADNISLRCLHACVYLIRDCLDIHPDKRPSMNQVVNKLALALNLQYQNRVAKGQSM